MSPDDLQAFRVKRLDALVNKLGSNNELGRRLGMSNGTFIGQLRRGERAISEKFIAKVEANIRGTQGWFEIPKDPASPTTVAADERTQLINPKDRLIANLIYLGSQLDGLDDYRRNAVGQLLLGLTKEPSEAAKIAEDVAALIANRGKMAA